MSNSALLKSSIAKKYWMAFTGLFLCLFLVGHLLGNLQLFVGGEAGQLQFNEYAKFMTTNPAVKLLSYVTYLSILFHAIDGIVLTIQNKAARPVKYMSNNANANSNPASRNMAVLGTLILVFIATHMVNFWAKMHFDENIPLDVQVLNVKGQNGEAKAYKVYQGDFNGQMITTDMIASGDTLTQNDQMTGKSIFIEDKTKFYRAIPGSEDKIKAGEGLKDLHSLVFAFFGKKPVSTSVEDMPVNEYGAIAAVGYALAMLVLMFHLWHGFASAFQSLGLRNKKYKKLIETVGYGFAVIVPVAFAAIPLFIAFS